MNEKTQNTVEIEGRELLTERMLEKVSGGNRQISQDAPGWVWCNNCAGKKVYYDTSGNDAHDYECDICGWYADYDSE